jgi:hypothetical protein
VSIEFKYDNQFIVRTVRRPVSMVVGTTYQSTGSRESV